MPDKNDPIKLIDKWFQDEDFFANSLDIEVPKREYENKLIAWIDVLGMSKKIIDSGKNDSGAEDILTDIGKLRSCVAYSCEQLTRQDKLDFIQLNDGFIIECEIDSIDELCRILCEIQWKVLVEIKMLIRGALTAGQIKTSTNPNIIIGPAFINAHRLENENAIFPRILFSDDIYTHIDRKKIKFSYISKDADNLNYLDYLKYEFYLENNKRNFDNKLKVHGIKKLVIENYNKYITENTNIAQKYGWIISKLSELQIIVNH